MTPTAALLILAWVAIVLLALALGGVVAQQRVLHAAVTGSPRPFGQTPVVGNLFDSSSNMVNPPYIGLFVTPGCRSCSRVLPSVVKYVSTHQAETPPLFIVSDQAYTTEIESGENTVTWLVDSEASQRFGIPAFPWLVVVDASGNATDHAVAHDPDDVAERIRNASPASMSEKGPL